MNKAKEISALWEQIKPQIGELVGLCCEVKDHAEVTADAYQRGYEEGLNDAWNAVRKIRGMTWNEQKEVFGTDYFTDIIALPASECIEKIRQYEQKQEEQKEEKPIPVEDVMRQYLDTFCKHNFCTECILHTPDFTCGRGYHFLTKNPVPDEEVRRAYAKVLQKMKE